VDVVMLDLVEKGDHEVHSRWMQGHTPYFIKDCLADLQLQRA
jgi:hypothetical protein